MKKSRRSMIFQFFFSYILCLLFPLVIFVTVILLYSQTTMKNNTLGAYASIQQGNVQDVEQVFRYAHNTAFRMSYENAVYKLNAASYEEDRVELNFLLQKVINSLRISSSQLYQTEGSEAAIYFERSGAVATPSTKYSYPRYMEQILGIQGAACDAAYIRTVFSGELKYLLFPDGGGEKLVYVIPLEMFGADTHTYLITAIPVQAMLTRGLENFPLALYHSGTPVSSYALAGEELPDVPEGSRFGKKVRLGGASYYQVSTAFSLLGLGCMAMVPTSAIWRQLHTVYLILALLVVTTVSLGTVFSWFLSKHSYRPIRGILRALEPYRGEAPEEAFQNEAAAINETVGRLVANNTQLQTQVSE